MELKDFIKRTLTEIVQGVEEAGKELEKSKAVVNPTDIHFQKEGQQNYFEHGMPVEVRFDVALTESASGGKEGGIGVFFGAVGIGGREKGTTENVSHTRIQFSVPLLLPPGEAVGGRSG